MAQQHPDRITLTDPVDTDPLSSSGGKTAGQIVRDVNTEVEALGDVLAGPIFKNPEASTATSAVSLANCTSLSADGPRSPAAVWTSYGQFGTAGPALTIGSTGGSHVQAVFTPPNNGWVVCNLGADYTLVNALALTLVIYPGRTGGSGTALTNNSIRENLEILVSDAAFTGLNAADSTPIIAGNTVTSVPSGAVFEVSSNTVVAGLGSLTKIRSIAVHLHDITDYSSVMLRIGTSPIQVRETTELEASIAAGPTVVPASYAPSGTQSTAWSLGNAKNPVLDLRPGYQIIYNYGGEHHVREAQLTGYEDGSADAASLLRRVIAGLKPHEKLVFPPNATYLLGGQLSMTGLSDIEVDFNGATFFRDGTNYDVAQPYVGMYSCKRMKVHGFHLFGHFFRNKFGSDYEAISGTTVVGTTRTFTAQNHAAKGVPVNGMLARDKDGFFIATFILSDTTHVAKDCRILLQTGQGTTLGYRDLTLTSTPTTYTVKIKNSHYLHEPMQWQVKKMTATANTITLANSSFFGSQSGAGGGPPFEIQRGIAVRGSSDDIEVYDFTAECIASYLTWISTDQGYGRDINFHDFRARCINVQGLGIVSGGGPIIHDNFIISEITGNAVDLEPDGQSELIVQPRITNGIIRNCSGTAFVNIAWDKTHDILVDNIKVIDCDWGFAWFGLGSVGGTISNIDVSQHSPTGDFPLVGPAPDGNNDAELLIQGCNVHWHDLHLSRGFRIGGTGAGTYANVDEDGWYDGGVHRYYETGNNLIENIFIDGGIRSFDWTNAQVDAGIPHGRVIYNQDGGSNIVRNVTFASQSAFHSPSSITTPQFVMMSGVPEFHGLEGRPWQRAAPHVFRAAEIGTPHFTPGGTQAFSQSLYDVQSLSGAIATPVVWIPAGTSVAPAAVGGTPTIVNGPSFAVAPDGVLEANCEVAESASLFAWYDGVSTTRGVGFVFQGSMDNVTWRVLQTVPESRIGGGGKRVRVQTGPFLYARMYATNYDLGSTATVSAVGNWVGTRGNNLRMLNVPVAAGATTLAVTFPNKVVPPTKTWAATAATGGSPASSLAAGTYSYRVGLRGPHTGPGVPDAARSATVVTNGSVDLKADIGVPDPSTGWYASSLTVFRKSPGITNYTQRADIIPVDPVANYRPFGTVGAWRDFGPYMRNNPFGLGYAGAYDWVTIPGGGYTSAQLDTHNESGWEPDVKYGLQITPSWSTTVAITAKTVSGYNLSFSNPCPVGGGFVDVFIVR
jgi:hypothetical protein